MSPVEYVSQYNKPLAEAFGVLRSAAVDGPLDTLTYELIVTASLVAMNEEGSFKVHARRVLKEGGTPEMLRQAVTATLAASTNFSQVVRALKWVETIEAE